MKASWQRQAYRLKDDGSRVVIKGDWFAAAVGAGILAVFSLAVLVLATRMSGRVPLGLVLLIVAIALALKSLRATQSRIVLDGARREVAMEAAGSPPRAVPFDAIRGLRVSTLGRGFQFSVELAAANGESIELCRTGEGAFARELASRLVTRFGFAVLPDEAPRT